jgi:hypothetical protein
MKYSILIVLVLSFSSNLFAKWAIIPLDELVRDSDLIVIGTLYSAAENDSGIGEGRILVDEIIGGRAKTLSDVPLKSGDSLIIRWADDWACAAGMHMRRRGEKGLWLVRVEADNTVSAAYPGRFISLDERTEVTRLLRKAPISDIVTVETGNQLPDDYRPVGSRPRIVMVGLVADTNPSNDYSLTSAALTFMISVGLYFLLYRKRV